MPKDESGKKNQFHKKYREKKKPKLTQVYSTNPLLRIRAG
jgi:hypothetical protein